MNSFFQACGVLQPLQLSVRGPTVEGSGLRLLHQPFALIGRDPRADVLLDHRLVSRRHVYLQVVEGRAFWLDLESRSGTICEGQSRRFGWLEEHRSIRIGPFELRRVQEHPPHPDELGNGAGIPPLIARSHIRHPLPEVTLEFLNGPAQSACWPMNRVMSLIGSASGCKFRLADPSVSPFHCSLLRTPLGLWVVDLLGADCTGVNDTDIRYAPLADGDILRVGRYRIRIHCRFVSHDRPTESSSHRPEPVLPQPPLSLTGRMPWSKEPSVEAEPSSAPPNWHASEVSPAAPPFPVPLTSNLNWTSSLSGALTRGEKSDLTETVLVPLVHQFGMMQQQMLDQFQQAIAMLVQMFGTMHRDQMELIREELDQLRDVTKEFHALKAELATYAQRGVLPDPSGQPSAAPGANPKASTPRIPPTAPMMPLAGTGDVTDPIIPPNADARRDVAASAHDLGFGSRSWTATATDGESSSAAGAAVLHSTAAVGAEPPPVTGVANDTSAAAISSPSSSTEGGATPPSSPSLEPSPGGSGPKPSFEPSPRPGPESERDVVVWLHQRMMVLQEERETRWQKILKLLPGLS
jgi:pSer/pThr/pTyr-binding forkhead associated (FHA) protein